jgi:hypothetical protein
MLLDEARTAYGDDAWDETDTEHAIFELVTGKRERRRVHPRVNQVRPVSLERPGR